MHGDESHQPLAIVIEDDPDSIAIYSTALKAAGFAVETVMTGDKALERLAAVEPALVVLDMHLPNVAGADIIRHIRSSPRLAETQVIIITGDQTLANDPAFQLKRVVQILVKPVSYRTLRDLAYLLNLSDRGVTL